MNYGFFDYKYNIEGFTSDLFSVPHIVFIVLTFLLVPLISYFLRKTDHSKIDKFIKYYSIFVVVFEVTKITWESYYDITTGRGLNVEGIMPFYTCSLFIYTMILAGWTKGKTREYSLSFLTTICMICGAIGVVQCNGLNYYPFWTFGAFYSLIFHFSMFSVGVFLLFTKYKKLEWSDIIKGWIPMIILSLIATPMNYEYGADYMQIYDASGVPLMNDLAKLLAGMKLRFVFTNIMLAAYIFVGFVPTLIVKIIYRITDKTIDKN